MRQPVQGGVNVAAEADLLHEVAGLTRQAPARADGIALGTLERIEDDGTVLVSIASMGLSRIAARSIVPLDASHAGQACALGFEGGDPARPLVLGLMLAGAAPAKAEVRVDGERVVLSAENEIELRCGEAAIILSADGRIQLRGVYITSHASATQRLLGGSVNIN
jgi:hypothetical protein